MAKRKTVKDLKLTYGRMKNCKGFEVEVMPNEEL
jgi:hypothetical protein